MRPSHSKSPIAIPFLFAISVVVCLVAVAAFARSAPDDAVARARARGPEGLDAYVAAHADVLARGPADPAWPRVTAALDAIAAQKDAAFSRLYWYTDLEAAKAAARASGRPILSLRLLGRLDEELSCANSRYFRTVLYADPAVAAVLRTHFVLHWSSERPAPRITIDYGDGRVVERTITGNSAHVVLDAQGRPVDAIPGLWTAAGFLAELARIEPVARELAGVNDEEWRERLVAYHRQRLLALDAEDPLGHLEPGEPALGQVADGVMPTALEAAPIARSKMAVQSPLLREILPPGTKGGALDTGPDLDRWNAWWERHEKEVRLSPESIALMRLKEGPGSGAPEKSAEERFDRMTQAFTRQIARDQMQNQLDLHRRIHAWYATGYAPATLPALCERLYGEVFLTPREDPWLGLVPEDTYVGMTKAGLVARP